MKLSYVIAASLLSIGLTQHVLAQQSEYVSPLRPVPTGKAPGMKVQLLDSASGKKTYMVVFAKGDEIVSGLTDFAKRYQIRSAHYQGIGDAFHVKVGWFDYSRNEFKVIPVDTAEVSSFTGDIAVYNSKPVAHTHASVAVRDGSVKGGHLLELIVGPTMEVVVTVEPAPMFKKLDPEFNAGIIDPDLAR